MKNNAVKNINHSMQKLIAINPEAIAYIQELRTYKVIKNDGYSEMTSMEFKEGLEKTANHRFVSFLKKESNFLNAKEKFLKNNLIPDINTITYAKEGLRHIALEFSCANVIQYSAEIFQNDAKDIVVAPKKWMKEIKKIENKLGALYLFFELSAERYLYWYLIKKTLSAAERNIFHSGKKHPNLAREFFIKHILANLFTIYDEDLSSHLAASIVIDIAGIFFDDPMDISDATKLAERVKSHEFKNNEFLQKKVMDILLDQAKRAKQ